jgi:hypothetical protein
MQAEDTPRSSGEIFTSHPCVDCDELVVPAVQAFVVVDGWHHAWHYTDDKESTRGGDDA